jgi:hypothetical protein
MQRPEVSGAVRQKVKFTFSRRILKNLQISNATKIPLVGAESFHADNRQTDRHVEANDHFS